MAFTRAWDEAVPAGGELRSLGDDRIRQFKQDIRERMGLEHLGGNLTTDPFGMHAFIGDTIAVGDSPYTATNQQTIIYANTAGGDISMNLPTAVGIEGKPFLIRKTSASNVLEIDGNGAQTICGYSTYKMKEISEIFLISDGANWLLANLGGVEIGALDTPHPYRNLVIQPTAGSTFSSVDVSYDECRLSGTGGDYIKHKSFSGACAIGVAGLNGLDAGAEGIDKWYYIWAGSDGGTPGLLFSESGTAPTLPAGYYYKALLGAIRNDGNGNFQRIYQRDNRVLLTSAPGAIITTQNPIVATDLDLGAVTGAKTVSPPTAKKVDFYFELDYVTATGYLIIDVVQDTIQYSSIELGYVAAAVGKSRGFFSVQPNTINVIQYSMSAAGATVSMKIVAWEY